MIFSHRIIRYLVVAAVALAVGAASFWGTRALGGSPPQPIAPVPATPTLLGDYLPSASRQLPRLTEAQIAEAKQIVASAGRVQILLAGAGYEVTAKGPQLGGDRDIIGAVLQVSLAEPTDIEGQWPMRGCDKEQVIVSMAVQDVTALYVWVDLNRGAVAFVDVAPGGGTIVSSDFTPCD